MSSNLHSIYTEATKLPKSEEKKLDDKSPESQLDETFYINWLKSPQTQDFFDNIRDQIKELTDAAINMAVAYPTTQNHHQIIANLVRIDILRKQLKYGRR